jgi:hypothetical protein
MMTVRATWFACMRSRRASGEASSAGGCAPGAKGKAVSCFQTWTCESMSRGLADAAANGLIVDDAMEAAIKRRRFHMEDSFDREA